ncbi:unnamed protein product [Lasius platythorax]|uniref:Uncharacterized protein n=1 Tax=Lasius platythorax TaxID=488582 RepID=A0AAV2MYR7_9HYME
MIPAAEETTLEELAEVPVIDQAQDVQNAEPKVTEQNPDEHQRHNPNENREENPDVQHEKDADEEATIKDSDQEVNDKVDEGEQWVLTPSFKYSL